MSVLDRIRRFWLPGPGPDHPLTEAERQPVPETAVDEVASLPEALLGEPYDPDAATERP
jgi:hypothetical protein